MTRPILYDVGRSVRALRSDAGLTLEEAAGLAEDFSTSRWHRLEVKARNLDRWLTDLEDAAAVLEVSVEELIRRARIDGKERAA